MYTDFLDGDYFPLLMNVLIVPLPSLCRSNQISMYTSSLIVIYTYMNLFVYSRVINLLVSASSYMHYACVNVYTQWMAGSSYINDLRERIQDLNC